MLGAMPTRLIRVFLALAIAFVFTGRLEAAAAHCAQLAEMQTAMAKPMADMPATMDHCNEMAGADKNAPVHPAPPSERCECLTALQGCMAFDAETRTSARIEPYAWARPGAIAFTSTEPAPDFRPPRA
ncbi:MAG TPA: hypothetical protein VG942_06550 [Hyphomonadaceae bacterium]|nr:hypothetical protein [Hyphomonadaceae bacterium]